MKILKFNPQKSKAQAMVEFAIVLPILLLVVYGLIEVGRLLFIVSSVNNATRQAVRYGSTSGVGTNGPRYLDCPGIRAEVQRMDFLNVIDDANIDISYDSQDVADVDGDGNTDEFNIIGNCNGLAYAGTAPATNDRIVVSVEGNFDTIVPLVPMDPQTIDAMSTRTLLLTISIAPPKEPTITYITADSPDPSEIGQSVTVSVLVTGTATTPTGQVTITGADTNCTIDLNPSDGTGSCVVSFSTLSGGGDSENRTLTASYLGDAKHDTSSDTENHTVEKASTTVVITSDTPDPSQPNQAVSVSVSVSSSWPNPTGFVDITGADTNCTVPLSGGTGSCDVNFANTTSPRTLTATYTGDGSHKPSDPDTEIHNVTLPGGTVTTITSHSPDPSGIGQSVTVSVAVTGSTTPTGSVTISGADTNCTIPSLTGGTGSCNVVFSSAGSKTLTAIYNPDTPTHITSSGTADHNVQLAPTITTITSDSPDPSAPGATVSVIVTVTGGSTLPTGTVNITGADTNCSISLINGTGSCNVIFNSGSLPGSKTLTATYNGDSTHAPSNGTASHTLADPPVANCNSSNIIVSKLKMVNGDLTIDITNNLTVTLQIANLTVTWNHDKGHQNGTDHTLRLQSIKIGSNTFWTGDHSGATTTPPVIPNPSAFISPGTSTITFNFHQEFDRWDNTEEVTINLANSGCESLVLFQNQH